MRISLSTLFSHWRLHPLQLVLLILGLSLATALWSAVQAINGQARIAYAEAADSLSQRGFDRLVAPDGVISVETYVALRRAGWPVSPVLEGRWREGDLSLTVIGFDLLSSPLLADLLSSPLLADLPSGAEDVDAAPLQALTGSPLVWAHPDTVSWSFKFQSGLGNRRLPGLAPRHAVCRSVFCRAAFESPSSPEPPVDSGRGTGPAPRAGSVCCGT